MTTDDVNYFDEVRRLIEDAIRELRQQEDVDIRAALAKWDIPGLIDNAFRMVIPGDEPQLIGDDVSNMSIGVGRVIRLGDGRHRGTHPQAGSVPVRYDLYSRTFGGSKYTVVLVDPDEVAKVPLDPQSKDE